MPQDESPKTGVDLQAALHVAAEKGTPKLRKIAAFATQDPESFARMSAREICAQLDTSEPTLIRFCRQFGHAGLADFRIELVLAMAAQKPGLSFVPHANDRRRVNIDAKQIIAERAIDLVADDRSLLIDNGSTAEAFAGMLERTTQKVVMTNGLKVAQNALECGRHRVMLTGGDILPETGSLRGRLVEDAIKDMHFDTFIMGADSIHPPSGVSTYSEAEAHITRAMLERAMRVIVLADHSKFRRPGLHHICALDRMDILVTDRPLAPEVNERLTDLGVVLVVAQPQWTPGAQTALQEISA